MLPCCLRPRFRSNITFPTACPPGWLRTGAQRCPRPHGWPSALRTSCLVGCRPSAVLAGLWSVRLNRQPVQSRSGARPSCPSLRPSISDPLPAARTIWICPWLSSWCQFRPKGQWLPRLNVPFSVYLVTKTFLEEMPDCGAMASCRGRGGTSELPGLLFRLRPPPLPLTHLLSFRSPSRGTCRPSHLGPPLSNKLCLRCVPRRQREVLPPQLRGEKGSFELGAGRPHLSGAEAPRRGTQLIGLSAPRPQGSPTGSLGPDPGPDRAAASHPEARPPARAPPHTGLLGRRGWGSGFWVHSLLKTTPPLLSLPAPGGPFSLRILLRPQVPCPTPVSPGSLVLRDPQRLMLPLRDFLGRREADTGAWSCGHWAERHPLHWTLAGRGRAGC